MLAKVTQEAIWNSIPFIFPVWVHCKGTSVHFLEVFEPVLPADDVLSDEVEQPVIPCSTAYELFPVKVATSFPWCDGFQRWWLGCSNEPLNDTEM
jgi:hypothetical protein